MKYFAHSDPKGRSCDDPDGEWQPLAAHLRQVADFAERFAAEAGASPALIRRARALGLLHDSGKYSLDFQRRIRGDKKKAPHSDFGAALAYFRGGRATDLAFAIAGHHGGMPDQDCLRGRLVKAREKIAHLFGAASGDCPEVGECLQSLGGAPGDALQLECATRILFSCLIDADRLDTARHGGMEIPSPTPLDAGRAAAKRVGDGGGESSRNGRRAGEIGPGRSLEGLPCRRRAPGSSVFPDRSDGGAKTLASMAFALRRAELFPQNVRRIVVVIPYLSIIEQNARVFREALGSDAVVEHHSGIWRSEEDSDEDYRHPARRLATENWNAPVIVTTSVRFFEALFSNKPGDLRRMHNLARSVVILDEVQTLPRGRVAPILSMIRGLAEDWGTTFVFSTATQPALEKRGDAKGIRAGRLERWTRSRSSRRNCSARCNA